MKRPYCNGTIQLLYGTPYTCISALHDQQEHIRSRKAGKIEIESSVVVILTSGLSATLPRRRPLVRLWDGFVLPVVNGLLGNMEERGRRRKAEWIFASAAAFSQKIGLFSEPNYSRESKRPFLDGGNLWPHVIG